MTPTNALRRRIANGFLLVPLLFSSCGNSDHTSSGTAAGTPTAAAHRHDVPGQTCFTCDPTKREAGRLWCDEHDRYEDRCWECHPELMEKGRLFCDEHGLYEDECHLCRPKTDDDDDKTSKALPRQGVSPVLQCNDHRVPESQCGICQPQLAAALSPGRELQVRFESLQSAAKAGIRTSPAGSIEAQSSIPAICEVTYNENELARITPLAPAIVKRVLVDVGADVKAGDVLVELHSAEVASAKSAFISAVVDLKLKEVARERERRLAEKKISSEKEVQEADAACSTAGLMLSTTKQRLFNYGFTKEEVDAIAEEQDSSAILLVRAPYEGTIVERAAVVGEAVAPGDDLFTLANLDTMWLTLSIPADKARLVKRGLTVRAVFAGHSGDEATGTLTWVNTSIDERTRMLKARAVVDNTTRALMAGMFGEARVLLGEAGAAVSVPQGAVQRYEKQSYVFVKVEDDLYSLRRVALVEGYSSPGDFVAVLAGLTPNEPVVTVGAFTVMSEFLKSRLGAGCTDD